MIRKVYIDDINTNELELIKESKNSVLARCVYYNKYLNEYIKIWNKDYYWGFFFKKANILKIHKNISLLKYIIYDKDENILGYATRGGKVVTDLKKKMRFCKLIIDNKNFQNEKYNDLLKRLYKLMEKKGVVYLDLLPWKIAEYNGKYYFFDLETFVRFEDLFKVYTYKKLLHYCPIEYEVYSKSLIAKV